MPAASARSAEQARTVPAVSNQSDLRSGAQSTLLYIVVDLSLRPTKVKAHPLPQGLIPVQRFQVKQPEARRPMAPPLRPSG